MKMSIRRLTAVALISASLAPAAGADDVTAAELSELCVAANAPELDGRYTGMELGEDDPLQNFADGETLTVSATNPGGPLIAIAIMVTPADIFIDQEGPEFTLSHTYVDGVNGANWVAITGNIVFGDVDWIVTCEGPAPPEISPYGVIVIEPAAGQSTTVQLPVFLSRASSETITVDYASLDDRPGPEATSGEDFVSTSGTLIFQPGETVAYVPIEILGDDVGEQPLYGGEWGVVQFSNPSADATLDTDTFFGAGLVIVRDNAT